MGRGGVAFPLGQCGVSVRRGVAALPVPSAHGAYRSGGRDYLRLATELGIHERLAIEKKNDAPPVLSMGGASFILFSDMRVGPLSLYEVVGLVLGDDEAEGTCHAVEVLGVEHIRGGLDVGDIVGAGADGFSGLGCGSGGELGCLEASYP